MGSCFHCDSSTDFSNIKRALWWLSTAVKPHKDRYTHCLSSLSRSLHQRRCCALCRCGQTHQIAVVSCSQDLQSARSFCLLQALISNGEAATITNCQKLRLQAVHCKQHNQSWSASKIGMHIGCSSWVERQQQSGSIDDRPRSGRSQKADVAAAQYICMAAKLPECTSAADIAAKTQQATGLKLSTGSERLGTV